MIAETLRLNTLTAVLLNGGYLNDSVKFCLTKPKKCDFTLFQYLYGNGI